MRGAFVLLLLALAAASSSSAGERLAWDVDVRVVHGAEPGSEELRQEIERGILAELNAKGCFHAFRPAADPEEREPAPLLLEVTLAAVREETRYDQSQAERINPIDQVETALGYAEVVEATLGIRLAVTAGNATIREDSFRRFVERRPMTVQEDARQRARQEMVKEVARETRSVVCRGSSAKLDREIRARIEPSAVGTGDAPR